MLKDKWWSKNRKCQVNSWAAESIIHIINVTQDISASSLQLENIGGTFLLLMAGLGVAAGAALMEWGVKAVKRQDVKILLRK